MKYLPALYLGFALGVFAKLPITDWRFWAIIVPFWILNELFDENKSNNKN